MSESSLYDDVIMDHIKNARNYRALDDPAHKASGTNPFCGDEMTVYLRLDAERVKEAAFQCSCCGISMASASMMTELVTGKTVAETRELIRAFFDFIARSAIDDGENIQQRALAEIVRRYPVRRRCALLPWRTLEAALDGREEANVAG
jgi:nitrogen fixation NifU-like protein